MVAAESFTQNQSGTLRTCSLIPFFRISILLVAPGIAPAASRAEIGPVFKLEGLSAEYDGAEHALAIAGDHIRLFWREPGEADFVEYKPDVSFTLDATGFTFDSPTSGFARSAQTSVSLVDNTDDTPLLIAQGTATLISHANFPDEPMRPGPGLIGLTPSGGSLDARWPLTMVGGDFQQEFVDWNADYAGTINVFFYWAIPEPTTLSLLGFGSLALLRRKGSPCSDPCGGGCARRGRML